MNKTLSFISSDFPHLPIKCEFRDAGSRKFVPTLETIYEINVLSYEFLAVLNVIVCPITLSDLKLFNLPANVLTGEIAKGFKKFFFLLVNLICNPSVFQHIFKTDRRCDLNLYKVSKDEFLNVLFSTPF